MAEIASLINSITDLLKELGSYINLILGFLLGLVSYLITSNPKFLNKIRKFINLKFKVDLTKTQDSKIKSITAIYELNNGSNENIKFNTMYLDFGTKKFPGNSPQDEQSVSMLLNPTKGRFYINCGTIKCERDWTIKNELILNHADLLDNLNTVKPKKFRLVIKNTTFGLIKSKWNTINYP